MSRLLLALAVVSFATPQVLADGASPFPTGTKSVKAVSRIVASKSFPDHRFLVVRSPRSVKKPLVQLVEVRPGDPLELTGLRRDWSELFIVSASAAEQYRTAESLAEAIKSGHVPAVRYQFDAEALVPAWSGDKEVTITYRVQWNKSGDGLEVVRTTGDLLWSCTFAAVLFAAAFLLGGLLLARRLVRSLRAKPTA